MLNKIEVTFEDQYDGTVKIICKPEANLLFAKFKGQHKMSHAESMAIMCLLKVLAESKRASQKSNLIHLPGVPNA